MNKENSPEIFMRENIKGKSDIAKCDHGDWFRDADGECSFIEGYYILNGNTVVLTCGMLTYMRENEVKQEFECQNCGNPIPDDKLTEILLCDDCIQLKVLT